MFLRRTYDQSVRYVNHVTDLLALCSLYKNTIYYFQYQNKNTIFNIQSLYFFLVNSSNLMDTIKTIIELMELKLYSTVNS